MNLLSVGLQAKRVLKKRGIRPGSPKEPGVNTHIFKTGSYGSFVMQRFIINVQEFRVWAPRMALLFTTVYE